MFVPALESPFGWAVNALSSTPRELGVSGAASLLKVFLPYVVFDTVFDNRRVVEELGEAPLAVQRVRRRVLDFAVEHGFTYPHQPWPAGRAAAELAPSPD